MNRIAMLVLPLTVLVACGGGGGGSSTPEGVFEKAKSAAKSKDWRTVYSCFNPQESDLFLFGMLMGASFSTMSDKDVAKELESIQTKHGLKEHPDMKSMGGSDPSNRNDMAKEAVKDVKDKPGLFDDLMRFMEKQGKGGAAFESKFVDVTLKDVKITGETATGQIVVADGKSRPTAFVRHEGAWYLSMER